MGLYNPPRRRDRGVPAMQILHAARRPLVPAGVRYGLLMRPEDLRGRRKPLACPDLTALARHIHRARDGAGVQMADSPLVTQPDGEALQGVSVWALDPSTGDRRRFLGWAWLNGAGRETLAAALRAVQPSMCVH